MRPQLITEKIWQEITSACKASQYRSYIAVAYFGKDGAVRLPLSDGSVLVVDASEAAVKAGQTSPEELIKLYRKGVSIYSMAGLHAKVYVIGTQLFIGSANVSSNSEKEFLKEAMFHTTSRKLVTDAKKYVEGLATVEIGLHELRELKKLYKERKLPGGHGGRSIASSHNVFLYKLDYKDYQEESLDAYDEGKKVALEKIRKDNRHVLDDFEFDGKLLVKKDDIVIQVVYNGKGADVYYPARVLHIKLWKDNRRFIYLERLRTRSKPLSKALDTIDKSVFKRAGRKAAHLEKDFVKLWKPKTL